MEEAVHPGETRASRTRHRMLRRLAIAAPVALLAALLLTLGARAVIARYATLRPDTLAVNVTFISASAPATTAIFSSTLHDAAATQALYQRITTLHRVGPGEVYHCPAGFLDYYHYTLRFLRGQTLAMQAEIRATGCEFIVTHSALGDQIYCCMYDYWQQLHDATGAPLPYYPTHR